MLEVRLCINHAAVQLGFRKRSMWMWFGHALVVALLIFLAVVVDSLSLLLFELSHFVFKPFLFSPKTFDFLSGFVRTC